MKTKTNIIPYNKKLISLSSSFTSGNSYLDNFLKTNIALDDSFGKTFVWLNSSNTTILGYYNLGLGYIEQNDFGIISKIGGSVHINCFAMDTNYHNKLQAYTEDGVKINLSDIMLYDCIDKAIQIRKEYAGFSFITLSSTKEGYSLYLRNGFMDLDEDMSFSTEKSDIECTPMYLPMDLEDMM